MLDVLNAKPITHAGVSHCLSRKYVAHCTSAAVPAQRLALEILCLLRENVAVHATTATGSRMLHANEWSYFQINWKLWLIWCIYSILLVE